MNENSEVCTNPDLPDIILCPFDMTGECIMAKYIENQCINGSADGEWTKAAWDRLQTDLNLRNAGVCLDYVSYLKALKKSVPKFKQTE
ncbi:MAG TPA: hypothetical protein VG895_00910 [Patescibacteria group bacterium]|nr:hypothetical protein [Patescibacteria group bacterium]